MAAASGSEPFDQVLNRMRSLDTLTAGIQNKIGVINDSIQNQIVARIADITRRLQTIRSAINSIATTHSDAVEQLQTQIRDVDTAQQAVINNVIGLLNNVDIRPIMTALDGLEAELQQISASLPPPSGGPGSGSGSMSGGYTYGKNRRRRRRGKKSKKKKGSYYKMKGKN